MELQRPTQEEKYTPKDMQAIANAYFKKLAEYGSGPRKEKLNFRSGHIDCYLCVPETLNSIFQVEHLEVILAGLSIS